MLPALQTNRESRDALQPAFSGARHVIQPCVAFRGPHPRPLAVHTGAQPLSDTLAPPSHDDLQRYRRRFLRQDARFLAVFMGLGVLAHLLFLRADHLFARGTPVFFWLMALRLGLIGFSALAGMVILRVDDPDQYDRWAFCWAMSIAVANTLIMLSRPGVYTGHVSVDLFVIIALYAVQPGAVWRRVLPPLLLTLGSLAVFFSMKIFMGFVASLSTVITYATANAIGWIVSSNWRRYRQSSFLANLALEQLYRRAEAGRLAAEASEKTWERIIDASPDLLFVIDSRFRIRRVNRSFVERLGLDRDAVLGQRCCEVLCACPEPPVWCLQHRVVDDRRSHSIETLFHPLDICCRLTAAPLFDPLGRHEATVFVVQDITEQKRTERELKSAREQYRSLVENSHGIIYTIRPDGVVTYTSSGYAKLLGGDPAQVVGKHFRDIVHPDDVAVCEAFQSDLLSGDHPHRGLEYRIAHQDGSLRWHLSNFIPIRNDQGQAEWYVGNAVDITEQKLHQAELSAAREAAEAASKAKSDFLALISHEIRTPLNAMVGFSALARRTNDFERLYEYVDILDQSSRQLMDLVNDVLDMSKAEAGKLRLESIAFNLPEAVDLLQWQYAQAAARKNLNFEVRKDIDLPVWVKGDPLRLRQILSNLLSNAVKFTSAGSVTLTVQTVQPAADDCCALRIEVCDTGIGIDEAHLASLFQPFQQIDPGIARKYGGTGLGLAIVRRLVELMNGRVEVSTLVGQGSCFVVELPFLLGAPPEYEQMEQVPVEPMAILVVEDNLFNRRLLNDTLHAWGHDVVEAEDAAQALALMDQQRFDCVVLDVRMPDVDGVELTCRLRRLERLGNLETTPIIGYTADTEGETREQCLAAGMQAVLFKPLDPRQLAAALANCRRQVACRTKTVETAETSPQPKPAPPADNNGLTESVMADMGHDPERIEAYRQLLWADIAGELNRLDQAVLIEDRRLCQEAAHSLKGLCGYLRDSRLRALALSLHSGADSLPCQELHGLAKQLRGLCGRAVE
jgi:PAS domain S-box-containing protein